DWVTYELTHLLVADLSWSGSLDGPERAGRYARERYGAAGPAMLGYLLAVERAGRTLFDRPAGDYGNPRALQAARAGLREAAAGLDAAGRAAAPGSAGSRMIARLRLNLDYALADIDGDRARMRELLDRHGLDGILLDDPYARWRVGARP